MTTQQMIEDDNLSHAWGRALLLAYRSSREVMPLTLRVTGLTQHGPSESSSIRTALDAALQRLSKQCVETVANTLFPQSLWVPGKPREILYQRYRRIKSQIRKSNPRGTYFGRMVDWSELGLPHEVEGQNQLEIVLRGYGTGKRRSMAQISIFDPLRDHSNSARLSFPCLQHVTFAKGRGDSLQINAFYATQTLVERAYGNYLGLCRLGGFVARELGLRLTSMNCFVGIAKAEVAASKLKDVLQVCNGEVTP